MKEDKNKKPSLMDTFKEAAVSFGPGLVAGMGTKDPLQIYKIYSQDLQRHREEKQREFNREQSLQRSADASFEMMANKRRLEQADRRLSLEEAREKGKQERFDKRFSLLKEKESQLSNTQIAQLASFKNVQDQIKSIKELKFTVETGPAVGRYKPILQLFGVYAGDDWNKLTAETASVMANYVKSISGATVNKQEFDRLATVIPRMTDTNEQFNDKLIQFQRINDRTGGSLLKAIKEGQPLKREVVELMLENIDEKVELKDKLFDAKKNLDDALYEKKLREMNRGN